MVTMHTTNCINCYNLKHEPRKKGQFKWLRYYKRHLTIGTKMATMHTTNCINCYNLKHEPRKKGHFKWLKRAKINMIDI